jgi:hypothetical protein
MSKTLIRHTSKRLLCPIAVLLSPPGAVPITEPASTGVLDDIRRDRVISTVEEIGACAVCA